MKLKKIVWTGLMLFSALLCPAQHTERMMLSGNSTEDGVEWDFFCSSGRKSGEWTRIVVPSCWELEGFGGYNYGHDADKHDETGLYRTTFELPEAWKGRQIFIVFDGSMTDTRVSVNGKQAGDVHRGAFYRFKRDITKLVRFGKVNSLEVEVSKMSADASVNRAEREGDFWVFGGIFRPVWLEAVPKSFIEYSSIDARCDGEVRMQIHVNRTLKKPSLHIQLNDVATGKAVADLLPETTADGQVLTTSFHVSGVESWTAETPRLYDMTITLREDGEARHVVTERIGFRTIEVRQRDGVYINGQRIRFKGVNRHCFWPATGRTLSRARSLQDALLIKEMNMNAVRSSHYPPDKHFLEICDSLGLYVIDELCSWQKQYTTEAGLPLVHELVRRDMNHPSIIFWANGNEGGFNNDFDSVFPAIDIQQRPVIHPFGWHDGINTVHYICFQSGIKNMFEGRDIFMPTELLHGLYDGGHGAGLDDYWRLMLSNPLSAGMFLWDFADQAVVRTDRGGILDTDKDHGADGIVGPYREKEGSFYTVKEIWSPIYVEKKYITPAWDGTFNIENRYDFTNACDCHFSYVLRRFCSLDGRFDEERGDIPAPHLAPGERGKLAIDLPENWTDYDVLYLTACGPDGGELFTWSFELASPATVAERLLAAIHREDSSPATLQEEGSDYVLTASGVTVRIDRNTGLLKAASNGSYDIPLTDGPLLITDRAMTCKQVEVRMVNGRPTIDVLYEYRPGRQAYRFSWTMSADGILQLEYDYRPDEEVQMAGVTFHFPETGIEGVRMLANGPYRVYKNRLKGGRLNYWEKTYNDAITGERWEYPEFKGYYALFYAMRLQCPTPFEVYCASEDVFLHLFTPRMQEQYAAERNYTCPPYPQGELSFMDAIPAVGTKFWKAERLGPQSGKNTFKSFSATPDMRNKLYFNFNPNTSK